MHIDSREISGERAKEVLIIERHLPKQPVYLAVKFSDVGNFFTFAFQITLRHLNFCLIQQQHGLYEEENEEDKLVSMRQISNFLLLTCPHFTRQQEMKLHCRFDQRETPRSRGLKLLPSLSVVEIMLTCCADSPVRGKGSANHRKKLTSVLAPHRYNTATSKLQTKDHQRYISYSVTVTSAAQQLPILRKLSV